jgi:hypothetical protein
MFRCVACDHTGDADFVGARNVLTKTIAALGHVRFPELERLETSTEVFERTVSEMTRSPAASAHRDVLDALDAGDEEFCEAIMTSL